jgi:hypothetical protein
MAADRSRLAAALAYEEERRRRMMESVPGLVTTPAQPASRADFRTNLENLSIGLGEGLTNQLEGIKGIITDPVGTAKSVYETGRAVIRDPSVIADALRYTAQKATSGPLGAGEVIGEMLGPRKGGPMMKDVKIDKSKENYAKQFQDVKDQATQKVFLGFDPDTGDLIRPVKQSLVIGGANQSNSSDLAGKWTLEREIGDGSVRLSVGLEKPAVGQEIGNVFVDLEAFGDAPKGTGTATEMYLEALAIAQEKGAGFTSSGIRSDAADAIYQRLRKKGVPFKFVDGNWMLTPSEVRKLDLANIAATPYKR